MSFGDLKRAAIRNRTEAGLILQEQLDAGKMFDPKIANKLVVERLTDHVSLSGFPISDEECEEFELHCQIIGIIDIFAEETALLQRFANRGICPVCRYPGKLDERCPNDLNKLVFREDVYSSDEFAKRTRLYELHIRPFIDSGKIKRFPRLQLDSVSLTPDRMTELTVLWMKEISGAQ